jgi:hypothetical protein
MKAGHLSADQLRLSAGELLLVLEMYHKAQGLVNSDYRS